MIDDVKRFAHVNAEETGPGGRLLLIEAPCHTGGKGKESSDGGMLALEAMLTGSGVESRREDT